MDNNLILELKNKVKKRKIIEVIIFIISIILFIISSYFLKKVNVDLLHLIVFVLFISIFFCITTFVLFIYDLISQSVKQANSNGDDIIIYRGIFTVKLYVNNELIKVNNLSYKKINGDMENFFENEGFGY